MNPDQAVSLREYFAEQIRGQQEQIDRRAHAAESMLLALWKAHAREHEQLAAERVRDATVIDRRLESMNELRAQITSERGSYVTRDFLDARMHVIEERLREFSARVEGLNQARSNMEGRFWMLGATLAAASVVINLLMNWMRH